MNEHVQQFIDRRKREIAEERKKLLSKIPEFQIREYSDLEVCNKDYPLWDVDKKQPYRVSSIEVSEDDFEEMKKYLFYHQEEKAMTEINTEKINKYPTNEEKIKAVDEGLVKPSNAADKTLSILAIICLILAFVGLIVGFIGLSDVDSLWWDPTLLIVGFSAFGALLIEWAILRLLVNISVRLRQINNNLQSAI